MNALLIDELPMSSIVDGYLTRGGFYNLWLSTSSNHLGVISRLYKVRELVIRTQKDDNILKYLFNVSP